MGYLALQAVSATPAAISPASATIDAGQTVQITVSWHDGTSFPYSVNLYSSLNSTCSSDSTPVQSKGGLSTPMNTFSQQPGKTIYYCGLVVSTKGTSAISKAAKITVGPSLDTPIVSIIPADIDSGQSANLVANVTWGGGLGPYSVTLYSGFSSTCSSDTTLVSSKSAIGTSATFPLQIPGSTSLYCAAVKDSATTPSSATSSAAKFTVNQPLGVTITPSSPVLDSGQSISLTATPSHGTSPYSYQWSSGTGCGTPLSGKTTSTFSTGAISSTTTYSVSVTDSGKGTPASSVCASDEVKVNSLFRGSFINISGDASVSDAGQAVNLTVSWTPAGTSPYALQLSTSQSSDCSSPTAAGAAIVNLTTTSSRFTVRPNSTTTYCATVTDSASAPQSTSTTLGDTITVHAALSATLSLSPPGMDVGQSGTVTATVTVPGGTPPYSITLLSGTSNNCNSDNTAVHLTSGTNPRSGVVSRTTTFTFAAPISKTVYCALVVDSASSPEVVTAGPITFSINQALTATITPPTPGIDSGQGVTLTAVPAQGTPGYFYQWSTGNTCAAAITGATAKAYATGTLTVSANYSVKVTDNSPFMPLSSACASVHVKVNPVLTAPNITLSSPAMDIGQTATITATVSWTGGTSTYSVTLTSGNSATCSSDTTVVVLTPPPNPQTGVVGTTAMLSFPSPAGSTYYCATVKDTSATPVSAVSASTKFSVNSALGTPSLMLTPTAIDFGQTATVTATVNWAGGTSTYVVTVYSGSSASCAADTNVVSISAPLAAGPAVFSFTAPASTTDYCASVKDSAVIPESTTSVVSLFTVNPVLSVVITPVAPAVDSGQSVTFTLTAVTSGGTNPYSYQWYSAAACTAPISGQTGSTYSPGTTPVSNTTYYVKVMDSSTGSPVAGVCASDTVTVHAALSAALSLFPSALDVGQSTTVTATLSWTGGASPYSVVLRSGFSSTCASDTTVVATRTNIVGKITTFTFTSPIVTTYYCATVTDAATVPTSSVSSAFKFTISPALSTPTTSLSVSNIDFGQSVNFTATVTWSGGTSTYTATLYSGSSSTCSSDTTVVAVHSSLAGSPTVFPISSPGSTTFYCATVADSASIPVTTTSATAKFNVNPAMTTPTLGLSSGAINSGQTYTITATVTWTGGTTSYTVTLYSGSSSTCTSDNTVVAVVPGSNPLTGLTSGSATFTFPSPGSTTKYCAKVVDTSFIPVTKYTAVSTFTINTALSASISPSSATIDNGQSILMTAIPSGGTPAYSYQWYTGSSCTTPVGGATASTYTPSPPVTTSYSVKVTDASPGSPAALFCASAAVTVNTAMSAPTITIGSGAIANNTSTTLNTTVGFAAGTPTYTCQWLVDGPGGGGFVALGSFFPCTAGSLPSVGTGTLTTGVWAFKLEVIDSAYVPFIIYSNTVTTTVS
ncbi:MAG: hypothetical protein HY247_04150 [archaeon]|nr:MAG: hypothetical protein HY247_04150 [archaeon]